MPQSKVFPGEQEWVSNSHTVKCSQMSFCFTVKLEKLEKLYYKIAASL